MIDKGGIVEIATGGLQARANADNPDTAKVAFAQFAAGKSVGASM